MGPAFGLLAEHLPADFFPIFFNPPLSLEAEIPRARLCVPAVALGELHWGRLEGEAQEFSCSGCLTVCSSRQGEPEGLVTAALLSAAMI